jgi:hypothetical protein
MANEPFDRVIFRPLERPVCEDWNATQSEMDRTTREILRHLAEYRGALVVGDAALQPAAAFFGDGFKVRPMSPAAMQVQVSAGMGFLWAPAGNATNIDGVTPAGAVPFLDDREGAKPLWLSTAKTINVPAADATNPRYDIVEVNYARALGDLRSRDFFDVGVGDFVPTNATKCLGFSLDAVTPSINGAAAINYKTGTAAASPTEPTVTSGYVKIGTVRVQAASTTVPGTRVIDRRKMIAPGGSMRVSVLAIVDTSTWAFTTAPTIIAPPGVVVGVETDSDYNGLGVPAVYVSVFAAGMLESSVMPAVAVSIHDGTWGSGGDALAPLTVNLTHGVAVNAAAALGTGATAYYPNPSPDLPIGQSSLLVVCAPFKWNTGAQDWTGTLPNPLRVSFTIDIPVGP